MISILLAAVMIFQAPQLKAPKADQAEVKPTPQPKITDEQVKAYLRLRTVLAESERDLLLLNRMMEQTCGGPVRPSQSGEPECVPKAAPVDQKK